MKHFNSIAHIAIVFLLLAGTAWMQYEMSLENQRDTKPLKELMKGLLDDMQQINEGLMYRDFEKMASASERIAHHPKITEKERQMIASELGPEMKTFVSFDKIVHNYADSLSKAAEHKDLIKALQHYKVIQTNCINCHEFSRERIREFKAE